MGAGSTIKVKTLFDLFALPKCASWKYRATNIDGTPHESSIRATPMAKSVVGTFAFEGEDHATVSSEVSGALSEALTGFREQVMDHLTTYMKDKPVVGGGKTTVDANEDAFADNSDVEEDDVDRLLNKTKIKRQKT